MKRSLVFLSTALLLAGCTTLDSDDPTLVIENARVLVGDGRVIENASVVVGEGRIIDVSTGYVAAPGAQRIDATGRTVMPGMIDTHVHPLMEQLFAQPRDDSAMSEFIDHRLADRLEQYSRAGITTINSEGDFSPFSYEVRNRLRSGEISGPRLLTPGPLVTASNGHPAVTFCEALDSGGPNPWCREQLTIEVNTVADAEAAVDRIADAGADHLKLVYDNYDDTGGPDVGLLEPGVVRALIDAAHARGLRVHGHISETAKAIFAVESGLDRLVHLPAIHTNREELDRLVALMRAKGVSASSTLTIFDWFRTFSQSQGADSMATSMGTIVSGMERSLLALSRDNSRLIALGTDSPHLPPAEAYHREIELVSNAGLSPRQVIEAATRNAAEYIGMGDTLGTVEAGKIADLIMIAGDPLSDISTLRNVVLVVRDGEIIHQVK